MRNTICAALTAITLVLCAALAGCGNASKTSTPAPVIAATGTTCSKRSGDDIKECIVTLSDTRKVDCVVYAQAMSLRTGEPAKVFHAETGLVAFTVRPTTKDTK